MILSCCCCCCFFCCCYDSIDFFQSRIVFSPPGTTKRTIALSNNGERRRRWRSPVRAWSPRGAFLFRCFVYVIMRVQCGKCGKNLSLLSLQGFCFMMVWIKKNTQAYICVSLFLKRFSRKTATFSEQKIAPRRHIFRRCSQSALPFSSPRTRLCRDWRCRNRLRRSSPSVRLLFRTWCW